MAREGGSYVLNDKGEPVLQERTDAVVTTAQTEEETTSEVTHDEDA